MSKIIKIKLKLKKTIKGKNKIKIISTRDEESDIMILLNFPQKYFFSKDQQKDKNVRN